MNILVIGGAGYIGSHCVRQITAAGHRPVVLDNLVLGHRASIGPDVRYYDRDLGDREEVATILREERIDVVMHFAAFAAVGESMQEPLKFYDNNVAKVIRLLEAMRDAEVGRIIFSSSCTVFGNATELPIHEDLPRGAINVYGQTKLDIERLLESCASAYGMSAAVFRYFNASGAAEDGSIGEDHDPETNLVPLAFQAAMGQRDELVVFGDDYPTPDGTCLRDYVHVDDLSRAHLAVIPKLESPGTFAHYNLGTGTPASVLEVIRTVEKVSGLKVPYSIGPRRPGDMPAAYADNRKAKNELGWEIRYPSIESIAETAWRWHRDHPNGFGD